MKRRAEYFDWLTMHIEQAKPCYPLNLAPDICGPDWVVPNGGYVFRVGNGYILVAPIRPELAEWKEE